ncbi:MULTISPECIES: flavodoxin family protein [unclassified Butyrivibrio]|uniref:flavodoxin family protein n=1 Tax=unclassified Butyrivibrio TaxID=2639466 RepID=UPI0003B4F581|nr:MULTISPECIES: flavodoxin [unclassified Butyrivibrio]
MKRLIVYYSLEGNTEYIAEKLAENIGAETLKLIPKKSYHTSGFAKFFWGGKSAVMAEKPELEPYEVADDYEEIIIGFPVWAGNITPPIRTFVSENGQLLKGKRISAFACQSGAGAEKAFSKLKGILGIEEFFATAIFIDPKDKPSEANTLTLDVFTKKLN